MFAAVLDACVLRPSLQRDLLLSMAVGQLYAPLWSDTILDELEWAETDKLVARGFARREAGARARRLTDTMRRTFGAARVEGWHSLVGTFDLPDPHDEHVLAAAVAGEARLVVTDNLKDFPNRCLPPGLRVLSASSAAAEIAKGQPAGAADALRQIGRRYRTPPVEVAHLVKRLVDNYGMHEVAEVVRPYLSPDRLT